MRRVTKVLATVALVGVAAMGVSSISQGSSTGLATMDMRQQEAECFANADCPSMEYCEQPCDTCVGTCVADPVFADEPSVNTTTAASPSAEYDDAVTAGWEDPCNDVCDYTVCQSEADAELAECTECYACHVQAGTFDAPATNTTTAAAADDSADGTDTTCQDDPQWDAGYGLCSTYAEGGINFDVVYCEYDIDEAGVAAKDACPESCGNCGSTDTAAPVDADTVVVVADDTVVDDTIASAAGSPTEAAVVDAEVQQVAEEAAAVEETATEAAEGSSAGAAAAVATEAVAGSAAEQVVASEVAAAAESAEAVAAEAGSEEAHAAATADADEAHALEPAVDEAAVVAQTEHYGMATDTFFARNNGRFTESFFWPASSFSHTSGGSFSFFARASSFSFFNAGFSDTFFSRFTSFGASESTFTMPAYSSDFFSPASTFSFFNAGFHNVFTEPGSTFFSRFGGESFNGDWSMSFFSGPSASTFFSPARTSNFHSEAGTSTFSVPHNSHAHSFVGGPSTSVSTETGGRSVFFSPATTSDSTMGAMTGSFTTFSRATYVSTFFYFYFA
jgi:hypothetical protein